MATTFGVLTFLILCASAFISFKNNERMEYEIKRKDQNLAHLQINRDDLKQKQDHLNDLLKKIPQVRDARQLALVEEAELKEINEKLKSDVENKTSKITSNEREFDDTKNTLLLVGEPTELVSKSKDKRIESQELDVLIENKESKLENLNAENTSAADLGARLKDNLDTIGRGDSLPTLKTSIRHIYPDWGFVTLANGYQSGVTGGSSLDIIRDGVVIGKLLVSTVERSSASASIIPDSIADDIALRVGDRVVAAP
jgi:hypothetical protein